MKKLASIFLIVALCFGLGICSFANNGIKSEAETITVDTEPFTVNAKAAYLIEANTGEVLFKQNEKEAASPASVTKIMTLLLVMEAIADGRIAPSDKVIISDYAASMGGSQVFLSEGEEMTVEELIKCAVIASANDAAVALAELVGGSEKIFVSMMNDRARELGMKNTNFENVTGLDDTTKNHVTSAEDIGIMSRELIKYDLITKYSSLWQDTIRNGEFTLTNTNRLVRYYDGCNGLKTGSTDKAGFCISAAAKRGEMQLIAVIMGAETRDIRNAAARELLDYGFSNFGIYRDNAEFLEKMPIYKGEKSTVDVFSKGFSALIAKPLIKNVEKSYQIPQNLTAPLKKGDVIGSIIYTVDGKELGRCDVYINEDVEKIGLFDIFVGIIKKIF